MARLKLFTIVALIILGLFASVGVQAQEQVELEEASVTVPANGTASLNFQTFCLELEKDFPAQLTTPQGRAADQVRSILKVAIDDGLVESDPLQTQMAIWYAVDGDWAYEGDGVSHEVAQSLVDRAANVSLAPLEPEGVPLDQAVADGTITITSQDFAAADTPRALPDGEPYYGRGTLTIQNNTGQDVTVYFPFGLVFEAINETEQDMVAFATELEESPALQEATPTPTVEATPEATETVTDTQEMTETMTTETITETEEMTATLGITTDTSTTVAPTPQSQVQPQPQALPSTGGTMPEAVTISLILILLGMIFCLSGALVMQMKRES